VPRGRDTLTPARAAFRHWPSASPHVATARAHVDAPVGHDGEAEPPLQVPGPINPPSSFPRAPEQLNQPPPPAINAAGELLAPLAPEANQ
jgi:hypothetical protein